MSAHNLSYPEQIALVRWAIDAPVGKTARLVLTLLATRADANYSIVERRAQLIRDLRMHDNSFTIAQKQLEAAGLLAVEASGAYARGCGRGAKPPLRYTLKPDPARVLRVARPLSVAQARALAIAGGAR